MDTKKNSGRTFRFIILIPHRDALKLFNEYRDKLFSQGFYGAYSFPLAAPLAAVSMPFSLNELKELGRNIRNLAKDDGGKILGSHTEIAFYGREFVFLGPLLNLPTKESIFPKTAKEKIITPLAPPVLCVSLFGPDEKPVSGESPALSFRAASLANLAICPLDCGVPAYSFKWKIGPQIWLPRNYEHSSLKS